MQQLRTLGKKQSEWETHGHGSAGSQQRSSEEELRQPEVAGRASVPLLSDAKHENARRFGSWDDFEEMELHSTLLIDKKGRVYWGRIGGDPFSDTDFIQKQLERMNELVRLEQGESSDPKKTTAAAAQLR